MKLKEIGRLIRDVKRCYIATSQRGKQWIGTGNAMYPVDGLMINEGSVPALFDLDIEEQKKIDIFSEDVEMLYSYPLERVTACQMTDTGLCVDGMILLTYGGKAYMLNEKKVRAAVSSGDYREYLLGETRVGGPVIIIYDGMLYAGFALPEPANITAAMLKRMQPFCECLPASTDGKALEAEQEEEGEQLSMSDEENSEPAG